MKNFIVAMCKDGNGNISSSRVLNVLIGVCGCAISWKLVIMGGYEPEYFYALLAYGAGVYGTSKYNERKSNGQAAQSPSEN